MFSDPETPETCALTAHASVATEPVAPVAARSRSAVGLRRLVALRRPGLSSERNRNRRRKDDPTAAANRARPSQAQRINDHHHVRIVD